MTSHALMPELRCRVESWKTAMILRRSTRAVLLAIYAYTVLFAFTRASDHFALSGSENGTCVACPVGTHAGDSEFCNCTHCECPRTEPNCDCSGYCETNSSCLDCEPGQYADKNATVVCKECRHGTYSGYGAANCTKCAPGTYAIETGQSKCNECLPGTHASHSGTIECVLCPVGYICEDKGCVNCTACPLGHTSSENRTVCDPCNIGSHAPMDGSPCFTCTPGLYCNHTGCIECRSCPGGQQPMGGYSVLSCEPCDPGWFRKYGDGLFCQQCPPGQYQEHFGKEECIVCPEGYYCPTPAQIMPCPEGAQCPRGSTSALFCQNLFEYDRSKKDCVPKPIFIVMTVLICVFIALVVMVTILAIYCHIYRRKKTLPDERIPLRKEKKPVVEPVYGGH